MHGAPDAPAVALGRPEGERVFSLLAGFALAALVVLVVRNAWVSDSAYVTLRTLDQLVRGRGLVWNPSERVMVYTHPGWLFWLAPFYAVTREAFYTTIAVSVATSLAAAWIVLFRLARTRASAVLAASCLTASAAVVDWSTSGLEGPLSHLGLALFLWIFFRDDGPTPRRLLCLSLAASLVTLTAMELARIVVPPLAWAALQGRPRGKAARAVLLGLSPLAGWELFAILYYGFPFPNPYYAEWNAGLSRHALLAQGLFYLVSVIARDPATAIVLAAGLAVGPALRRGRESWVALGLFLYLVRVIETGGDGALGRSLAAPTFVAAALLSRAVALPSSFSALLPAMVIVLVSSESGAFALGTVDDGKGRPADERGVVDERRNFVKAAGLLFANRLGEPPAHAWADQGRSVRGQSVVTVRGDVGYFGYFAGRRARVIDAYGRTDPLIARLPALWDPAFRPGPQRRQVPEGYAETVRTQQLHMADGPLGGYYERLARITRGKLFSARRLTEIVRMNIGYYDRRIDVDAYRFANTEHVDLGELSAERRDGETVEASGVRRIAREGGALVVRTGPSHARGIELSLDSNDDYELAYRREGETIATQRVPARRLPSGGLANHVVAVPKAAAQAGFDEVRIHAVRGDGQYAVGHIRLWD